MNTIANIACLTAGFTSGVLLMDGETGQAVFFLLLAAAVTIINLEDF